MLNPPTLCAVILTADAIPKVDVIPDGFDWFGAAMGLGGFVAAVVAIALARRAQRTADEMVASERRRVFELDVLRELMRALDEEGLAGKSYDRPFHLRLFALRLGMLSARLPTWDRVLQFSETVEVADLVGVGDEYRELRRTIRDRTRDQEQQQARFSSLGFGRLKEGLMLDADKNALFKKQMDAMLRDQQAITFDLKFLENQLDRVRISAGQRLREKLAYDVQQLILSNVEARTHRRTIREHIRFTGI